MSPSRPKDPEPEPETVVEAPKTRSAPEMRWDFKELQELARKAAGDNPEDRELAAMIATRLSVLSVRAAAGEDIAPDLRHIKAQAANLAASKQAALQGVLMDWVSKVVGAVVLGVLK